MMVTRYLFSQLGYTDAFIAESGQASQTANQAGGNMAQNHYSSKTKRRPKNSNRKDPSADTMAALRQLEAKEKKSAVGK
jgi:hypothetical protein